MWFKDYFISCSSMTVLIYLSQKEEGGSSSFSLKFLSSQQDMKASEDSLPIQVMLYYFRYGLGMKFSPPPLRKRILIRW